MRIMMHLSFPVDVFNQAVRDGSIGAKMQRILAEQKPEAAYFTDRGGMRAGVLIVNVTDASQIPSFAEPWFLTFNAGIEMHPVMTAEDLGKSGLDTMGKTWA